MNATLKTRLIADAKVAVRLISITEFDNEIGDLIEAVARELIVMNAIQEAQLSGTTIDPLIKRAIITFVRAKFGTPEDRDRLTADYEDQKRVLMMTSGYTDWGEVNG